MKEIKLIDYPDIIDYGQYYKIKHKPMSLKDLEKYWESIQPKRVKINAFD